MSLWRLIIHQSPISFNSFPREPDYTKGIFQSIGFKEFHPYLTLSETERNSPTGEKVFSKSQDQLVIANVQYAKRQTQWVRNRLLKCPDRVVPPVFSLNCTDLNQWSESVSSPAHHIVDSYLNNKTPTEIEPLPVEYSDPAYYKAGTFRCDVCNRVFVGEYLSLRQRRSGVRASESRVMLKPIFLLLR
ncbi:hypothetical protein WDU94_003278 [Cyamophila willieti]